MSVDKLTLCGSCVLHWGTTAIWLWSRRCCASLRHTPSSVSSCKQRGSHENPGQSRTTWSTLPFSAVGVSHVAVVALQKQLPVCVQQPHKPNILVNYSYDCLQEVVALKAGHLLASKERSMSLKMSLLYSHISWYLGVIVVCHYVKPGWDDRCLSCRRRKSNQSLIW